MPQNTATLEQTSLHTLNPGENMAPLCRQDSTPFRHHQASHLDEAMKGIMCLSSELADVCQRDLQARVRVARDTGALKLRFA